MALTRNSWLGKTPPLPQTQTKSVFFISDNISDNSKFQNIVHKIKTGEQNTGGGVEDEVEQVEETFILGLDYSRLCTLLWGVCKNQEARIQALEAKIT